MAAGDERGGKGLVLPSLYPSICGRPGGAPSSRAFSPFHLLYYPPGESPPSLPLSQTSFVLTSFPLVLVPSLLTLPFFSSEVVLGGCWAHNLLFAGPLSFRFPRTLHLFLLGARAWLEPEKAVTGNQKM